jgi:hypothetical protein
LPPWLKGTKATVFLGRTRSFPERSGRHVCSY